MSDQTVRLRLTISYVQEYDADPDDYDTDDPALMAAEDQREFGLDQVSWENAEVRVTVVEPVALDQMAIGEKE